MDLVDMTDITKNSLTTINYLRNNSLLKQTYFCCGSNCNEVKNRTSDGMEFKCNSCKKRYSIRTDSAFFNVHLPLRYLLLLIFLFATNTSVLLCSRYLGKKVGVKSIGLWYAFLRNVMTNYLLTNPIQLGGGTNVVEVDETCLGTKQKYHRGAVRGSGQKWVIGLLDRITKKLHIQWVPDRTRDTLLPIIQTHVLPGSIVHTDEAPVYRILTQQGFEHYTVKHKETYVAADGTHTNNIENCWCHLKAIFKEKHGVLNSSLPAHIDEFLYRWNRKNEGPVFELLLQDLRVQYPL